MVFSTIQTGTMRDGHGHVEVESILRIRPLLRKEREENVVLELQKGVSRNDPPTVVLNPPRISATPTNGHRSRADSEGTRFSTPTDYHFNQVLPESTSQEKLYYQLGLPMATEAMSSLTKKSSRSPKSSKNHVLITMGVTNSGKSYSCFGGASIPKRRAANDGLIPRLVDSLFSQSQHHASGNSRGFAVRISIMQVFQGKGKESDACKIYDLLGATSSEKKKTASVATKKKSVLSMAAKFEKALPAVASPIRSPLLRSTEYAELDAEDPQPTIETCHEVSQAREVLQNGLDASRKTAKGNRNFHLLVVMQPSVNNSKFGDKIAVLDLAGLEKGKRNQSRSKDIVGMNEAASCSVLNCLRTMIHNTNLRSGKIAPIDVADDLASEISCVSQEKDPYQQRMKAVPFRQHKVAMLLNPFFSTSQSTKVTLLMAAYPGHTDYTEKKSLLQDMELLCGSALLAANARVSTGFEQHSEPSVIGSILSEVESEYENEDESTEPPRSDHWRPKKKLSGNSFTLSSSSSEEEEDKGMIQLPPAYAPSYNKSTAPSRGHVVRPSAPEPVCPTINRNPSFVSDFPGVNIPSSRESSPAMHRNKSTMKVESSMVGGPKSRPPPTHEDKPHHGHGTPSRERGDRSNYHQNEDPRLPLGRSSLENVESMEQKRSSYGKQVYASPSNEFTTARKVQSPGTQERVVIKEQRLRKKSTPSKSSTPAKKSQRKRHDHYDDKEERIQLLEAKMQELLHEKRQSDNRNAELQQENEKLKTEIKNAERFNNRKVWTSKDEEEFQANRKLRLEDQTLLKAPVLSHLRQVDSVFDIKNQWQMTDKPHFNLSFPSCFQRAETLNVRDKLNEEREAAMMEKHSAPTPKKLTYAEKRKLRRSTELRRSGVYACH